MPLKPKHKARLKRWRDSLPDYAAEQLVISDKGQRVVPLVFNPMQMALHQAIEKQKRETGKVRIIVLKARQLGSSTYFCARIFHALQMQRASAYVLAHTQATAHLMGDMVGLMYNRLHTGLRHPALKATNELRTWGNGSKYQTHTASTPEGGRGATSRFWHSTETARQEHAHAHQLGSAQQVSERDDTEMYYESTAGGAVGLFYDMWRAAGEGRSSFMQFFAPWWIDPEYVRDPGPNFRLDPRQPNDLIPSEVDYAKLHKLPPERMAWRRWKMLDMSQGHGDGSLLFGQEYPANADEAFGGADLVSLIDPRHVRVAMTRPTDITATERHYPLMVGVDPAPSHGGSATAIAWRRGPICFRVEALRGYDPKQILNWLIAEVWRKYPVAMMDIDRGEGVGDYLYTELCRMGESAGKVRHVFFGGVSSDDTIWLNKRAECWGLMAQWFARGAAIPRDIAHDGGATLDQELISPNYDYQSERRLRIESKEAMRKRGVRSPDKADALACTFAGPEPVSGSEIGYHQVEAPFDLSSHSPMGGDPGFHVAQSGGYF